MIGTERQLDECVCLVSHPIQRRNGKTMMIARMSFEDLGIPWDDEFPVADDDNGDSDAMGS